MPDIIRILLADDQTLVREGLRALLATEPGLEVVAEAADAQNNPHVEVLVLTSAADEERFFAAFKAGASGYLLKATAPEELVQAIYDTARGKARSTQR